MWKEGEDKEDSPEEMREGEKNKHEATMMKEDMKERRDEREEEEEKMK